MRLSTEILMFLAAIWSSVCFWSPFIVCWLCCMLHMPLFGLSSKLPTIIFIFISKAVSLGKYMIAHLAFDWRVYFSQPIRFPAHWCVDHLMVFFLVGGISKSLSSFFLQLCCSLVGSAAKTLIISCALIILPATHASNFTAWGFLYIVWPSILS